MEDDQKLIMHISLKINASTIHYKYSAKNEELWAQFVPLIYFVEFVD